MKPSVIVVFALARCLICVHLCQPIVSLVWCGRHWTKLGVVWRVQQLPRKRWCHFIFSPILGRVLRVRPGPILGGPVAAVEGYDEGTGLPLAGPGRAWLGAPSPAWGLGPASGPADTPPPSTHKPAAKSELCERCEGDSFPACPSEPVKLPVYIPLPRGRRALEDAEGPSASLGQGRRAAEAGAMPCPGPRRLRIRGRWLRGAEWVLPSPTCVPRTRPKLTGQANGPLTH